MVGQKAASRPHRERRTTLATTDVALPYSWTLWRPRIWPSLPPGLSGKLKLRFPLPWALHRPRPCFAGRGCGVLLVYNRERLVHYSGFTPGYWRFPFIAEDDFQIGDTWTDPARFDRGRGLALFSGEESTLAECRQARTPSVVRLVQAINEPSIRVAEKAQFKRVAEGEFLVPWSFKLAGSYVIRSSLSFRPVLVFSKGLGDRRPPSRRRILGFIRNLERLTS